MHKCALIFCFLLLIFSSRAQQPAYFMFGEKQFEGVHIYSMIQDFDYNYWFATNEGIYKHDGYSFELVECDKMLGRSVFGFKINSKGVIYCVNLNQQVFQIKNGVCSLIYELPDNGSIVSLAITQDDKLFIGTSQNYYILNADHQLIDGGYTTKRYGFYLGFPFVSSKNEMMIHQSNTDTLLVYQNGKMRRIRMKGPDLTNDLMLVGLNFMELGGIIYATSRETRRIYRLNTKDYSLDYLRTVDWEDPKESLTFQGMGQYLWVSANTFGLRILDNHLNDLFHGEKCYQNTLISCVYRDREGNYLLGTFDNGIMVLPDIEISDGMRELKDRVVTRLVADGDKTMYLGLQNGEILEYNEHLTKIAQSANRVNKFFFWKERNSLICENDFLCVLDCDTKKSTWIKDASLKGVTQISADRLLIALNIGLIELTYSPQTNSYSTSDLLIEGRIYTLAHERSSGYTYISSARGLTCMKSDRSVIEVKYNGKIINPLSMFSDGQFTYVSTSRYGVLCFSNGKLVRKFRPQQLGEDLYITKMLIHDKKLFANSQMGLVIMDLNGGNQHFINKSRGLSVNRVIDFDIFRGELWVTHGKGVQQFDLKFLSSKVDVPTLILKHVRVNNRFYSMSKPGKFDSDQKKVSFTFRAPSMRNRDNIRYHYKLVGLSHEWTINTYQNNEVTYNSLAPGKYTLVVKVENNGVFSPATYYSFSIAAPFYMRTWFFVFCFLIVLIVTTLFYRRLLSNQRKKSQRINELNASRLTAIQSQMNPHFIFNSLNSIQDLVLKGDIDNSYTFITKFSNLVRRTLSYSEKDFIDFEQEIKLIELYLSLEKLRFKEDLTYTIETNGVEDIQIPPMLIQPFLENALVHGLLHREGKKELSVQFRMDKALICEITDNGVGRQRATEIKERQKTQYESFSTKAIKKRFEILESHFQNELGVEYIDLMDGDQAIGTKVILRLPTKHTF